MKILLTRLILPLTLMLPLMLGGCEMPDIPFLSKKEPPQQAMPVPPVTVYEIRHKDVPWPAEYQGQTQGSLSADVRSRIEGIIEKRLYKEGDYVKQGQLLFRLEKGTYEAKVQDAAAVYENALRSWKRIAPLYAQNAVSQKDRDSAKASLETANANLRQAKINLGYCDVVSPISGYTSQETLTVGNLVNNNTLLTTVNKTDPMFVNFSISGVDHMRRQALAAQGRLSQPAKNAYTATLRLVDGAEYPNEGNMDFFNSLVDPDTGVIKARVSFPNSSNMLLPGQYVRIRLNGDVLTNALVVPQKCIASTNQATLVMVVDADGKVSPRPVKIITPVGDDYLLEGGLQDGERIVLEGLVKARPGATVRVVENASSTPQSGAVKPMGASGAGSPPENTQTISKDGSEAATPTDGTTAPSSSN